MSGEQNFAPDLAALIRQGREIAYELTRRISGDAAPPQLSDLADVQIDGLVDPTITLPDGAALTYRIADGVWIPQVPGGGIEGIVVPFAWDTPNIQTGLVPVTDLFVGDLLMFPGPFQEAFFQPATWNGTNPAAYVTSSQSGRDQTKQIVGSILYAWSDGDPIGDGVFSEPGGGGSAAGFGLRVVVDTTLSLWVGQSGGVNTSPGSTSGTATFYAMVMRA